MKNSAMLLSEKALSEAKAISQLIYESNDDEYFHPFFNNNCGNSISNNSRYNNNNNNAINNLKTNACMCKRFDSNGFSPWLMDSEIICFLRCKYNHGDSSQHKEKNRVSSKTRDFRKGLIKTVSGETCLKFYHFDDVCEYMTQYRENVTLPVLMQHRTKLPRSCGECQESHTMTHDQGCNYAIKSPDTADTAWLSVAYVKQIETALINNCYSDSPGVSVEAIIEQVPSFLFGIIFILQFCTSRTCHHG